MAAIVCELCGSNDVVKQDGFFVCQHCGTKYSLEEAKKLIGMVQIDNSQKIENLFTLARRAKENGNNEDALKYYDMIRQELPNDWEANFFAVYFKALTCNVSEIKSYAETISNCIHSTFEMIDTNVADDSEKSQAVKEVCEYSYYISDLMYNVAKDSYEKKIHQPGITEAIGATYYNEYVWNLISAGGIKKFICDGLCDVFGTNENVFRNVGMSYVKERAKEIQDPEEYVSVVRRYEPDFKVVKQEPASVQSGNSQSQNNQTQSGGCYVATAVYGSYDCPQVWTLRRYRDYTLAESWYGRAFIHTYYAISPTLVKWFGETEWFKNMWKPKLDKVVKKLNEKGVADTPYQDRNW